MQRKQVFAILLASLICMLFTAPFLVSATANLPSSGSEMAAVCVEGQEPLALEYGFHAIECAIDDASDLDRFSFLGAAGDSVRVAVTELTSSLSIKVEIRDPQGSIVLSEWSFGNLDVELILGTSGQYTIQVSDYFVDNTGPYILHLEHLSATAANTTAVWDIPAQQALDHRPDIDILRFDGTVGDQVRLTLTELSSSMSGRIELRNPSGDELVDQWSFGNLSVDATLDETGPYLIILSDIFLDGNSDYLFELQCLFGACTASAGTTTLALATNALSFQPGETLVVTALVGNGAAPTSIEAKSWITAPDDTVSPLLADEHFEVMLPADVALEEIIYSYTFDATDPLGGYVIGGRLLDPTTGAPVAVDLVTITLVSP